MIIDIYENTLSSQFCNHCIWKFERDNRKDQGLIGMGSIVMDHCLIESNSIIAAGAVLPQGTHVPSGTIYAGVPAKKIKNLEDSLQKKELERIAKNYLMYASWFQNEQ